MYLQSVIFRNYRQTLCYSSTDKKAKQETFELTLQRQSRKDKIIPLEKRSADPNKLISVLFNILQEYSLTCTIPKEASTLYRPGKRPKFPNIDNETVKTPVYNDEVSSISSSKKICCSPYKQEKKKISNAKKRHRIKMFNSCTCTNLFKCGGKCIHCCSGSVKSVTCWYNILIGRDYFSIENKKKKRPIKILRISINKFWTILNFVSRNSCFVFWSQLQNDASPYGSWNKNEKKNAENSKDTSTNLPASLQDYVKHLDKYKEFITEVSHDWE